MLKQFKVEKIIRQFKLGDIITVINTGEQGQVTSISSEKLEGSNVLVAENTLTIETFRGDVLRFTVDGKKYPNDAAASIEHRPDISSF